ncbi:D-alanyl-D-alanine carboxypeptidase/D-alanyl-D-alanine endopeptidase [Arthrobacter agilis]|uniref:D-alanyl-D-alanine carboxypeptidase/D-alanyl-D-alanine endopeptidase n=1 Tax=Arthrobacter agilis TaxID=37921 RepID=UPI00278690FA|nr:D-alanyl-D-alanine carboxypeptidase/D-alanyl-D-alanine-endopeptidase [Arthrobacter agilis]MDQ0736748.1 D-alanyl-D-alanine carboxypeptidase/D-alanyl-D-alanine-endopeptidase (penicillin-binding protein 4) [Arthrobacter agilis]
MRPLRLLTGLLLVLVMAALAVPLANHLVPGVLAVVDPPPPVEPPVTPALQVPPTAVAVPDVVVPLPPSAPAPDPAVLGPRLDDVLQLAGAGSFAGTVVDSADGTVLYARDAGRPQPPASNIKLFTAVAAMTFGQPGRTLTTSVLTSDERSGSLYLHGGGDVLLGSGASDPGAVVGRAGLGTLAADTAAALPAGSGPYSVRLDDSLFEGAALNPTWAQGDIEAGEIAPLHALAVNSAWLEEGRSGGPRSQDAALDAARIFAAALVPAAAERGITVLPEVERSVAPDDAEPLAAVESAPLEDQMRRMLEISDNYLAEALARRAALDSGRPASFGGATEALTAAASELGVPQEGLLIGDAAGLSVRNAVSPEQLAVLVRGTTTSGEEGLAAVARSLPIAGATGTLASRFTADDGPARAGAGVVRAKTGTLNAVTGLSGHVVTTDGRLLVFSFLALGLEGNTVEARGAADSAAAVLAGCGCR